MRIGESLVEGVCEGVLDRRQHMAVDVRGHADAGVAEALLDCLDMRARLHHQSDRGMAKLVERESIEYSRTEVDVITDFARFPELRFLDRHDWIPMWALGVTCYLVGGWSGLI